MAANGQNIENLRGYGRQGYPGNMNANPFSGARVPMYHNPSAYPPAYGYGRMNNGNGQFAGVPMNLQQMRQQQQMQQQQMQQQQMQQQQMQQQQMQQQQMQQQQMQQQQMQQQQMQQQQMQPMQQLINPPQSIQPPVNPAQGFQLPPQQQPVLQGPAQPQPQGPVNYQPLDEKTMEEVRSLIAKKQDELGIPPDQRKLPSLPAPQTPPAASNPGSGLAEKLGELIQGERNAAIFYNELLALIKNSSIQPVIKNIADNVQSRKLALSDIYGSMAGHSFTEKESAVVRLGSAREAIEKAIEIETASVREISDLYEYVDDTGHAKSINAIIHKKLLDIVELQQALKKV